LRNQIGRDLRGIRKRLVVDPCEPRDDLQSITGGHNELGVARSEVFGHAPRKWRFVERLLLETDRERTYGLAGSALHVADDEGGVDASGKEGAHGHIRDHMQPDSLLERGIDLIQCFGLVRRSAPRAVEYD